MRLTVSTAALLLASSNAMADCNHPTPIKFAEGAGEASIEENAPSSTIDCYQFTGTTGQRVTVDLSGLKGDAVFAVFAPGWQATCDATDDCDIVGDQLSDDQTNSWSDTLWIDGAYLIVVDNSRSDVDYRLNIDTR
ncbi:MAG TPA: hypothetical protein VG651_05730 [Stellaceae bacterium]|nr:hypothetical protein [Stellaceae bacterium]